MFKVIIDWFMVNYEMYLLIGFGFAIIHYYRIKREVIKYTRRGYSCATNKWFPLLTILRIPFYPIFIITWLLNKLAQWK